MDAKEKEEIENSVNLLTRSKKIEKEEIENSVNLLARFKKMYEEESAQPIELNEEDIRKMQNKYTPEEIESVKQQMAILQEKENAMMRDYYAKKKSVNYSVFCGKCRCEMETNSVDDKYSVSQCPKCGNNVVIELSNE